MSDDGKLVYGTGGHLCYGTGGHLVYAVPVSWDPLIVTIDSDVSMTGAPTITAGDYELDDQGGWWKYAYASGMTGHELRITYAASVWTICGRLWSRARARDLFWKTSGTSPYPTIGDYPIDSIGSNITYEGEKATVSHA